MLYMGVRDKQIHRMESTHDIGLQLTKLSNSLSTKTRQFNIE